MTQQQFQFRTWGGKREGAGRKPTGPMRRVPHVPRAPLARRFPVSATWRMADGVWNLRSRRCFTVLQRAMYAGGRRDDFRVVHFAVMGNHVHLLVEAADRERLIRGMQGLGIRMARALNRVMKRRGRVVSDRYHARVLKTLTEVRNARRYLENNARKHYGIVGEDDFTSHTPFVRPRTWLLRQTC